MDGDLLHGGGVGLFSGDQSVADLMVGYDALFVVGQDGVLLLVACNDHLNALLQVRLGHTLAACADGPQRGLVDNVGQLGTGRARGHPGHGGKVDARGQRDLFGVDLQDLLAALEVGQLHGHPAVKAAGAGQGRVKGFGTVGGGQNDDTGGCPQSHPSRSAAGSGSARAHRCRRTGRRCAFGQWHRSRQ